MAKVRVYELAKDLNMTNKQLLEKLKELGIDAKSHMSALGSSDVAAVKQNLLGKKKRSNNEVKARRSVIRRRKTKTTSQTDEQERDEDMDDSSGPEEPTVQDSADQEDAQNPEDDAAVEEQSEEQVIQGSADAPESKKETDLKRPVRKVVSKSSEPAKIIKPAKVEEPPKPEPEPEAVAVDVEEKIEKAPAEDEDVATQQENGDVEMPAAAAELEDKKKDDTLESEDSGEDKSLQEPMDGDRKESPVEKQKTDQPEGDESSEEGNNHGKRKKKKKKTAPAKIVRVADPVILENIKRMKAGEHHSGNGHDHDRPARKQPVPETGSPDVPGKGLVVPSAVPNDRKRAWTRDEPQSPDAPASRKKRRKKKSVVEGNDLYRGRGGRKKKGKKDPKGKKG